MHYKVSLLYKKLLILFSLGLVVILLAGCNFTKVGLIPNANQYEFDKLAKKERIYILHIGEEQYLLNDLKIENDFITGTTSPLPADTIYHMKIKGTSLKSYMPKHKQIKKLVHIYVAEFVKNEELIAIPYTSIKKVEVYSKEPNMAATGYMFMGIAVVFILISGFFALLILIYGAG